MVDRQASPTSLWFVELFTSDASPAYPSLDIFEVVVLVAACFVVNYITADAKTNWAEGFTMICLYAVIVRIFNCVTLGYIMLMRS
jgi:Ca2+/H+ antiporter